MTENEIDIHEVKVIFYLRTNIKEVKMVYCDLELLEQADEELLRKILDSQSQLPNACYIWKQGQNQ